jgi:hypothetical protein
MVSSRGFASTRRDLRPLQARFHSGSGCRCLNRATSGNSPDHTPKGTPSPSLRPAPTAWKHTISGSLSLPSPGFFSPFPHGTIRYRSLHVACLGLWSAQLQTRFFVPGPTQGLVLRAVKRDDATFTLFGSAFQRDWSTCFLRSVGHQAHLTSPPTPPWQRLVP